LQFLEIESGTHSIPNDEIAGSSVPQLESLDSVVPYADYTGVSQEVSLRFTEGKSVRLRRKWERSGSGIKPLSRGRAHHQPER